MRVMHLLFRLRPLRLTLASVALWLFCADAAHAGWIEDQDGKTIIHVLADERPDASFESAEPDLEDVYFIELGNGNGRSVPAAAATRTGGERAGGSGGGHSGGGGSGDTAGGNGGAQAGGSNGQGR